MKHLARILGLVALGVGIFPAQSLAGPGGAAEAFERLKSMAGHWESGPSAKMKTTLDIQVVSDGSTVMEQSRVEEKSTTVNMITMYYLDGDQLKMTHYCMAGNQPTMRGTYSPETKTITFDFISATNLKSANDGHMHHAVYKFVDQDHVREAWTFRKDQKDAFTEEFEYVRSK
ncbi:MAG TPA: hypothetical protein VEI73_07910 [Candidatus Acidoferrum sp.]|nr:hypothetical protein [Candidatus Acidoferrum sp.]